MGKKIPLNILSLSAPTAAELKVLVEEYKTYLRKPEVNLLPLEDICYSTNTSPHSAHAHRIAVLGKTCKEMADKLENIDDEDLVERGVAADCPPKLCFLFSGHGAIYPKMGKQLYETCTPFQSAFDVINDFLMDENDPEAASVKDIVYGEDESLLTSSSNVNLSLLGVGYGLLKLWEFWGIMPNSVLGHSLGEYVAAVGAGVLRPSEGAKIVMDTKSYIESIPTGGMLALFVDMATTQKHIEDFYKTNKMTEEIWVDIAVCNSKTQTIIALSSKALPLFQAYSDKVGLKVHFLPIPKPFHCRGIDKIIPEVKRNTSKLQCHLPRCEYISSMNGQIKKKLDTGYWVDLVRNQIDFVKACNTAYDNGSRIFLEIGAQPVQSALMLQNIGDLPNSEPIVCLPSLRKNCNDWATIMGTFAKLYVLGYPINYFAYYYPFAPNKVPVPLDKKSIHEGAATPNICGIDVTNLSSMPKPIIQNYILELLKKSLLKAGKDDIVEKGLRADQDFSEIGLDSLQAVIIKNQFQKMLGPTIELKFSEILDCRTVAQLTDKICASVEAQLLGADEVTRRKLKEIEDVKKQMLEDMILPSHIQNAGYDEECGTVRLRDIKVILLAGVTGNLGPYLAKWLSKRPMTKKIYCLVRGKNGMERVIKRFEELGILENIDMKKFVILEGNITDERFGLSQALYDELGEEVEAIVNSSACTNHLAKYNVDDYKTNGPRHVNLNGTIRVLEFAGHRRTKWIYQASTGMASGATSGISYDHVPEEWMHEGTLNMLNVMPLIGYGISKAVSDYLLYKASKRGIPSKVFRFPKIGCCQDILQNHFVCKFLHFLLSGELPAFDIPLQIISVEDCADVTLRAFFDGRGQPTDIYTVISPYNYSELDMVGIGNEYGPLLRFMVEAVRLDGSEQNIAQMDKVSIRKRKLAKFIKTLDKRFGPEWMDNPADVLKDSEVLSFIDEEYGHRMRYVSYPDYVSGLERMGIASPVYPWVEFYTASNAVYKKLYERDLPNTVPKGFNRTTVNVKDEFMRNTKLELLYPNLTDLIESPLEVVRKDILFSIYNAKRLFKLQFDFTL